MTRSFGLIAHPLKQLLKDTLIQHPFSTTLNIGLDEDEIASKKMDKNEAKYLIEKAWGSNEKYDQLEEAAC